MGARGRDLQTFNPLDMRWLGDGAYESALGAANCMHCNCEWNDTCQKEPSFALGLLGGRSFPVCSTCIGWDCRAHVIDPSSTTCAVPGRNIMLPEKGRWIACRKAGTANRTATRGRAMAYGGADAGTRTRTGLLPRDFKSLASTIPPRPHPISGLPEIGLLNMRRSAMIGLRTHGFAFPRLRADASPRARGYATEVISRPRVPASPCRRNRSPGRRPRRTCWGSGRWR
jgi:hypothetical protein